MLLLGMYFLCFTTKQKHGKIFIVIGICVLYLLSCRIVSHTLLGPLEKKYSPYDMKTSVRFVVVLGGGHVLNPQIPLASQLTSPSLVRLTEGIRIYHKNPGTRLVFTGKDVSMLMANVAKSLGVDENDIIIENRSKDTKDEAKNVKIIVHEKPFALVTSASHMPRSVALFKKQGMNPVPASVHHLVKKDEVTFSSFFPNANELYKSQNAFYEYMGLIWAKLRGQI